MESDWVALMGASRDIVHGRRYKRASWLELRTLKNHFYISGVSREMYLLLYISTFKRYHYEGYIFAKFD